MAGDDPECEAVATRREIRWGKANMSAMLPPIRPRSSGYEKRTQSYRPKSFTVQGILERYQITRPGLEPGMAGSKPAVLPITPPGTVEGGILANTPPGSPGCSRHV